MNDKRKPLLWLYAAGVGVAALVVGVGGGVLVAVLLLALLVGLRCPCQSGSSNGRVDVVGGSVVHLRRQVALGQYLRLLHPFAANGGVDAAQRSQVNDLAVLQFAPCCQNDTKKVPPADALLHPWATPNKILKLKFKLFALAGYFLQSLWGLLSFDITLLMAFLLRIAVCYVFDGITFHVVAFQPKEVN